MAGALLAMQASFYISWVRNGRYSFVTCARVTKISRVVGGTDLREVRPKFEMPARVARLPRTQSAIQLPFGLAALCYIHGNVVK